ncbi:HET-domain-containing protein, partial [Bimuria novae-zelandiae CBS 107.79]
DIRLLTIYPSSSGEPLSCHLAHHALGTAPGYEAISYVWGDSSFTHLIFCDGKSVAVTNSLYEVLCRLRQPHEPRIIWIDGVCIDQSNKVERGQQVQLMGDIYREADRVIIWFGADPEGLAPIVFDRCLRISEQDFHGFRLADRLELTGPMNRFAECSWFERTWVIQELVLAKTAWVIWGKCEISWNHIQTA